VDKVTDYLALVDLLVFYSQFGAEQIAGPYPRTIIKGGVDTTWFTRPAAPPDRSHMLFVGRLLPHKGIDQLIEALPRDIPLVVCGRPTNPEYADHLRALAKSREVRFVYDASDEDIRNLYRTAWATVAPSVHVDTWGTVYLYPELMGLTVLESMACGTPAVVSTAGALPEFVEDGRTGHVVHSMAELGEICTRLARDPARSERMGAEAAAVVEQRYSLPVVGEALWRSYRDLGL
jgi:glycosyltransferase involved in cell wall biosynthesis